MFDPFSAHFASKFVRIGSELSFQKLKRREFDVDFKTSGKLEKVYTKKNFDSEFAKI